MIAVRLDTGHAAVYRLPRPGPLTRQEQRERGHSRAALAPAAALQPRTAVLVDVLGTSVTAIGRVVGGPGVIYETDRGYGQHWLPNSRGRSGWSIDNIGAVALVALTSDTGVLTVVSSRRGGTLRVFEPGDVTHRAKQRPRVLDQAPVTVSALDAYQSGNRRLLAAVTTEGLLLRYDLGTLRALGGPIAVGTRGPSLLRLLKLGERLCVALNGTGDALRVRDLFTGEHLIGAVRRTAITALRFLDRDGSAGIAGDEAGGLRFWGPHGAPAEEVAGHRDRVLALDALGDPAEDPLTPTRWVSVGADDLVHCWNTGSPHPVWSHRLERDQPWSHPPTSAVVLPLADGALLATAHDGGSVRVHHVTGHGLTETARFRLPDPDMVTALAAHRAAGRTVLAVATFHGAVTLWDAEGTPLPEAPLEDFPAAYPNAISLVRDADGTLVVVSVNQGSTVHLWTGHTSSTDGGPAVQRIRGQTALALTENGRVSIMVFRYGVGLERWIRDGRAFRTDETFGASEEIRAPRSHNVDDPRPADGVLQPDRDWSTDRMTALAALNSTGQPLRLLAGRASGRIDTIDTHLGLRGTPVSHDVHAVTAVALTDVYGGRRVVLSGTDDGRVVVNALDTGERAGHLTSWHTEPVAAVCAVPDGHLVRIYAVHRDTFIQRWDLPLPDGPHHPDRGGNRVLPVICDCPALHRTTTINRLPIADIPWEGWTLEESGRETVAGKDLMHPGGRMTYRIAHPDGFSCPGAWQVTAGHYTLVLAQDPTGMLRVGLPDMPDDTCWIQGVHLDITEPLAVCADPDGDRIRVLATDPQSNGAVLSTYALDAMTTPVIAAGGRYRLRTRPPTPLPPESRVTVGSAAASGLRALPTGAALATWAVVDGPLIRLLDRCGAEVAVIDVGANCHDLVPAPDGALVAATQRGTVVIDLPSSP
ncbi:hypothetical protein EBF04_24005 [Streptomyces sp. I6]|nr:hypothetical protein EBF04_24005 [Streptomyces sp. I6]